MNTLFSRMPTTIFEEMSGLARAHGAINLGQGFPDTPGPIAIREKVGEASVHGDNQYPSMWGTPDLRRAIAGYYRRQDLDIDPDREVVVTSGATEALTAAILALVQPGDEVVLFQPMYDSYAPMVRLAGGTPVPVSLKPPHWRFDRAMLEAAFTARTKVVIVNTPTNPTGVVMAAEDLALLAEFCLRHDAIAISDEVWEAVVMAPAVHRSLMSQPGMRERCVKVGSAGKLFALTGWKVGWMIAAPPLAQVLARAHQFLTYTTAPNLQAAVAWGLEASEDWFSQMPPALARSRDRLKAGLEQAGFGVLPTEGTYFLCVDLAASGIEAGDRDFCLRAVAEAGIAAIPLSAFYERDPVTSIIRLCFAKRDETLDEGVRRLAQARRLFAKP
jgi:aspartate/methionine/tyrosine aminotransferase